MIDNLIVSVVLQVWPRVVTSVAIDIVDVKFLVGSVGAFYDLRICHLFSCFFPAGVGHSLVSFCVLHSKIVISNFMILRLLNYLHRLLLCKSEGLHPQPTMVIAFEEWSKLLNIDGSIFIVVILLELALAGLLVEGLLDKVEEVEVAEDCGKEPFEGGFVHLLLTPGRLEEIKEELLCLLIVLVQWCSCTHELVKVYLTFALEIDVLDDPVRRL